MSTSTDPTPGSGGNAQAVEPAGAPGLLGRVPKLGVWAWSFVGVVVAGVIVFGALAAVSEIVLPMTFAAVLAVVFRPLLGTLQRRGVKPSLGAGLVGLAALLLGLPLVFTIVVVNFIGGYIPYIGAFLGGGLAVIVALGDGGLPEAAVMLVVVLAANLALENFVEPKVMGRTLDVHPLVVLVVTALGGLLGGIVGLILAVPAYVIAGNALGRLRSRGLVERVTERAQPTVHHLLE